MPTTYVIYENYSSYSIFNTYPSFVQTNVYIEIGTTVGDYTRTVLHVLGSTTFCDLPISSRKPQDVIAV